MWLYETAGVLYLKSPNTPQNKIVMLNNIHNPSNCYFKIHCAGFLQSQQFQVQNIHKLNAVTSICNKEVQNRLDCTGLAPST